MKYIELNILQFILLIIFIYIFTYFWLPIKNIKNTPEYKKLLDKYLKIYEEKEFCLIQLNNKNIYK